MVEKYCFECHNYDRNGRQPGVRQDVPGANRRRRGNVGESDPQAARRSHAAGRRAAPRRPDRSRSSSRGSRTRSTRPRPTAAPGRVRAAPPEPPRVRARDPRSARRSTSTRRHCCRTTTSRATSTTTPTRCRCRPTSSTSTSTPRARSRSKRSATPRRLPIATTYGDAANMVISLPPDGAPGTGRQQHHLRRDAVRHARRLQSSSTTSRPTASTSSRSATWRSRAKCRGWSSRTRSSRCSTARSSIAPTSAAKPTTRRSTRRLDPAVEEINGRLRKIRFQRHGRAAQAGGHVRASQLRRERRAHAHDRARGRPGAHPGRACVADPRAAVGHRHRATRASRAKIFICQPSEASDEAPCATEDRHEPRRRAFRRPVDRRRISNALMAFYEAGTRAGRLRRRRARCAQRDPGEPAFPLSRGIGRDAPATRTLNDLELASRLSFFLWSSLPDEELLRLADESRLGKPRRAGRTGEPHARRRARQVAARRFRVPVAARSPSSTRSPRTAASSRRRAACWIRARC